MVQKLNKTKKNKDFRLRAGLAITVLVYNNSKKQYEIKELGGISFESYRPYFESEKCNDMQLCEACFQIVVLARVINDRDQVWLTALGITRLVSLLLTDEDQVIIQSGSNFFLLIFIGTNWDLFVFFAVVFIASYLSSLAHTRSGITDAMITCDAVDILCDLLYAKNDQVKFASAVTLGYLTYNRTASRLLLHNCRNVPKLFDTLMSLIKTEAKISSQFIESFHTALALGLPKLLVHNKNKFYDANAKKSYVLSATSDDENENKPSIFFFFLLVLFVGF